MITPGLGKSCITVCAGGSNDICHLCLYRVRRGLVIGSGGNL